MSLDPAKRDVMSRIVYSVPRALLESCPQEADSPVAFIVFLFLHATGVSVAVCRGIRYTDQDLVRRSVASPKSCFL